MFDKDNDENVERALMRQKLHEHLFDASLSNSIYGASSTVQPIALDVIFIIKYSKG